MDGLEQDSHGFFIDGLADLLDVIDGAIENRHDPTLEIMMKRIDQFLIDLRKYLKFMDSSLYDKNHLSHRLIFALTMA